MRIYDYVIFSIDTCRKYFSWFEKGYKQKKCTGQLQNIMLEGAEMAKNELKLGMNLYTLLLKIKRSKKFNC